MTPDDPDGYDPLGISTRFTVGGITWFERVPDDLQDIAAGYYGQSVIHPAAPEVLREWAITCIKARAEELKQANGVQEIHFTNLTGLVL